MSKKLKGFKIIGEFDDAIRLGDTIIGINKDKPPQILDKFHNKFIDINLDYGNTSYTVRQLVRFNNEKNGK